MLPDLYMGSLHLLGSGVTNYILSIIDGLGEPNLRISQYNKPGEDGGIIDTSFLGISTVTLEGKITGSTVSDYWAARRALGAAARATYDTNNLLNMITFSYTALDGAQYTFSGVVNKFSIVDGSPTFANFQIIVSVPDGVLYGTTAVSSGLISRPTSGGVPFPLVFDPTIEFGSSSGGIMTVTNGGTSASWPLIYLRGILTNPTIYSQTQQKTMQLNTTLGASDVVTINMKNRTIMLNGSSSILALKTTTSDWFSISPGDNVITFSTGSTSDTGTMEVTFNPAYYAI